MAHPGFGHLWKQSEMSDIDIVIACPVDEGSGGDDAHMLENSTLLQQIPGHSPILSLSPYLKAQALRWSTPSQPVGIIQTRRTRANADSKRQAKQQVTVTLPDASFEPAAMAVLAGLYLVQPWPKLLADLTPQQQVQAAVLADMWQLPEASEAAVGVLQEATGNASDASAVLEQLFSLPAVPDCLSQVLEQAVISKFGNLEAVWGPDGASLQESLLALPLHAMELLLASDKLKVASEDTVLFTAQAYVSKLARCSCQKQAIGKLAPLVRCPHLSQFWMSASVLSEDADRLLLRGLQPQLKRLVMLTPASSTAAGKRVEDIPGAPASWLLPVRCITPVSNVVEEWCLGVADIRQAAQDSATHQRTKTLKSPTFTSPLGGVRFGMEILCKWDASKQGSTISVYTYCKSLPLGSFCRCSFDISCAAAPNFSRKTTNYIGSGSNWGWRDFFQLGAMPGGFDEAAWAAKGLPTSGNIVLRLTVTDVGK